jgi:type VI protein secretion system component VasF
MARHFRGKCGGNDDGGNLRSLPAAQKRGKFSRSFSQRANPLEREAPMKRLDDANPVWFCFCLAVLLAVVWFGVR